MDRRGGGGDIDTVEPYRNWTNNKKQKRMENPNLEGHQKSQATQWNLEREREVSSLVSVSQALKFIQNVLSEAVYSVYVYFLMKVSNLVEIPFAAHLGKK
ncbi:hypothetical protein BsWGS_11496 [Bradybaena similaris]